MYLPTVMKENWIHEVNQKYAHHSEAAKLLIKTENLIEISMSTDIIIQYANSLVALELFKKAKKEPIGAVIYEYEKRKQQFEQLWDKDAWILFIGALKFISKNPSPADALIAVKNGGGGLMEIFLACESMFGIRRLPVQDSIRYLDDRLRPRSRKFSFNVHQSFVFSKLARKTVMGTKYHLNDSIARSYTEILSAALFPEKGKTGASNPVSSNQKDIELREKIDLPFTNLADVACWKLKNECETGLLTYEEFSLRYSYKHGKSINPNSLKAAQNGTGQYLQRNGIGLFRLSREKKSKIIE